MDGLTKPDDIPGEAKPAQPAEDEIIAAAANDQALFVRLDPGTPPGPGAVLRAERESRGYSIDEVATALKLAPRQVEAIEADDFDALRGQTFARGFVKNYARLLQLDPDPLVARIKSSAPPVRVSIEPRSNVHAEVPLAGGGQGPVVAGGLAVLALVVVAVVGTSADWLGGDHKARDNRGREGEGGVALSQTAGMTAPPQPTPLSSSFSPAAAAVATTPDGTPAVATTSAPEANPVTAPATQAPPAIGPAAIVANAPPAATHTPQTTPAALPAQASQPAVAAAAAMPAQSKASGAGVSATAPQSASATVASAAPKPAAPRTSGTVMTFTTPKPASATAPSPTTPPSSGQPGGAGPAPRSGELAMTTTPTTAPTPAKARSDKRMVLSFDQDAWVEVRDGDGKVVFSQLNPAGAQRLVEGKAPLSFVVGNAHHVKLKVDEKPFDLTPHIGVTVARFSVQ